MDAALGKHMADIGGLVEVVGKQHQGNVPELCQIHRFPPGQGMILADEQLQVTFPQEQTVVGFFWQPVGDTEGKVDFLAVQQFIEHLGGFFHGFDGDLGMAFQESPVDLGENGIAPHGGNADPDQGFAGAQGPDHLAQIPVVVLELPGMLQQDPVIWMLFRFRWNRATPHSSSSSRMALEIPGWEIWHFSAAREKLPHSQTVMKYSIWVSFMMDSLQQMVICPVTCDKRPVTGGVNFLHPYIITQSLGQRK